jgi:hypothetical protein
MVGSVGRILMRQKEHISPIGISLSTFIVHVGESILYFTNMSICFPTEDEDKCGNR